MKKDERPLVSVIMSTYNRAHLLYQTIENIFEQDYDSFELIVINDGSIDKTQDVLEQLQTIHNFTAINNQKNLGLQKSLNKGIGLAKGKYIARIDDHDKWIKKDKLSIQVYFLEKHLEIGLVGTAYQLGGKNIINPLSDKDIRKQILMRCPFCHVTVLMRKSIVEKVGRYDEVLPYSEDWDLWLKIGTQTQFANLPDVTTEVIEEDASLSDSYFIKQFPINRQLVRKFKNDYPGGRIAMLYHYFIQLFFRLVPLNGSFHRLMKKVFRLRFFTSF
ncbi:MAG: glycosyltransferase involved in cell wall biosynthesis [Saprospiraceae bacterium]|jgi:glycosyltransferase involved in cell wall biosynthesis